MIIQNDKKAKTITLTVDGELPYYKYETMAYEKARAFALQLLSEVDKK